MRATLLSLGAIAFSLTLACDRPEEAAPTDSGPIVLSLIHISEPTRPY